MNILYINGLDISDCGEEDDDDNNIRGKNLDSTGTLSLLDFIREENVRPLVPGEYQALENKFDKFLEMKRKGQKYNLEDAQLVQERLARHGKYLMDTIYDGD